MSGSIYTEGLLHETPVQCLAGSKHLVMVATDIDIWMHRIYNLHPCCCSTKESEPKYAGHITVVVVITIQIKCF